jgi:DNA-binding CsgD family transcriptional regulator
MGISIGNARTKLKRVMVKTGAHSQRALMLLVERKLRAPGSS